jgi:hypothetical protein
MGKADDETEDLSNLSLLLTSNSTCADILNDWLGGSLDPASMFRLIDIEINEGRLDTFVGRLFKTGILQHGGYSATCEGHALALKDRQVFRIQGGNLSKTIRISYFSFFLLI